MVETRDGHVKSIHEGEATPMNDLDNEVEEDARAPRVEQLRAR